MQKILDMSIEDIKKIPMVDINTIPYSEENDSYVFPEQAIFYYWNNGYKPDQNWFKAELSSEDCFVFATTDIVNTKKEQDKAIEEMRIELVDDTIREKFTLICEKYMEELSEILTTITEEYIEVDKLKALDILKKSKVVSEEIKLELQFYEKLFKEE